MSQTYDFIKTNLNKISETGASFLSLTEYMDVAIEKYQKILAGDTTITNVAIPIVREIEGVKRSLVAAISTKDLRDAINGEKEVVTTYIDDTMTEVEITANEVQQAIEDQVTDFQVQSEFIKNCISSEASNAEEFVSSIKNKYAGVSTEKVQQYASLLKTNDKIGALKSWVSQIKCNKVVSQQDGTIEMIDRNKYTGVSVWTVVIDDFFTTIQGFFDKLWQGIQDIGGFFERLWNGLVKLGKYLLYKAFNYLSTNLTNGDSKIGILDFPLLQVDLGTIPTLDIKPVQGYQYMSDDAFRARFIYPGQYSAVFTLDTKFSNSLNRMDNSRATIDFFGHKIANYLGSAHYFEESLRQIIARDLLVIQRDPADTAGNINAITGYSWKAVDVVIPANDYADIIDGYVLRIGVTDQSRLVISLYASMKQVIKENRTDAQIFGWILNNFSTTFMPYLSATLHLPVATSYSYDPQQNYNSQVLDRSYCMDAFITQLSSSEESSTGPIDFASHIKKLSAADFTFDNYIPGSTTSLTFDDGVVWFIYHGLLSYYLLFGPISDTGYVSTVSQGADQRGISNDVQYALCWIPSFWVNNDPIYENYYLPLTWDTEYKPYLSYGITPASIHLQTITEQAKEIEWTIIGAILAIAAVALTVLTVNFRRKLKIDTEIARGQCDSQAWDMDPSNPEDRKEYLRLRKIARKKERLSRLFGVSSNLAVEAAQSDLSDSLAGISSGGSENIRVLITGKSD